MQRNVQRIVIFANGELPNPDKARLLIKNDDHIICADGGTRHALALGIKPHLVIGDMDSAANRQLLELHRSGVEIEIFSHDKNETDLELALNRAVERVPRHILIVAALGGRLDQTLANITLLTDPRLAAFDVRLDDGVEQVFLCRETARVEGSRGDLLSLLPWQGPVTDIVTTNLKWRLDHEALYPDRTRGISNEMLDQNALISIGSGMLLVIHRRKT